MPIPAPHEGETEDKFISRCMKDLFREFPEQEQRAAVCYRQWRERKQKSNNGYEYQELADGRIVVYDVPTYWCHTDPHRDEPFDNVDPKLIDKIYHGTVARMTAGAYPQLYIGPHIDALSAPDTDRETQLVGYMRSLKIDRVSTEEGDRTGLVGDYVFDRASFEQFVKSGKTPRRSAEIIREEASKSGKPYLLNVTMLGVSMPALAAKDMVAFTGDPKKAVVHCELGESPKENNAMTDEDRKEMNAAIQSALNSFGESFAEKFGLVVNQASDEDKEVNMEDGYGGKKDGYQEDGEEKKENNEEPLRTMGDAPDISPDRTVPGHVEPSGTPETGSLESASAKEDANAVKESYKAQLDQVKAEAAQARKEVAELQAARHRDWVRTQLVGLTREGYKFNFEDELDRIKVLNREQSESEISRIRDNYQRAPIVRGANLEGLENYADAEAAASGEDKFEARVIATADRLMKEDPALKYHQAKSRAREMVVAG